MSRWAVSCAFLGLLLIFGLSVLALSSSSSETTGWAYVSVSILLISVALIYRANRGPLVIAPALLFLIYYIFFLYIGALIRFCETPGEYQKVLRIVTLGIFFFSVGVFYTTIYKRFSSAEEFYKIKNNRLIDPWGENPLSVFLIFSGGLLLGCLYFIHAGGIPLFAEQVEAARVQATLGGGYFLLGITAVLPFVSLLLIGKAFLQKGRGMTAAAMVLVTATLMIFASLKDLVPFFLLWIIFFLQFYYGRLSKKMLLVPVASLLIATVMAGFTMKHKLEEFYDGSIFLLAFDALANRLFFACVDVLHFIFTSFPDKYDYLYGYSYWMNLTAALPGADIGFGGWLNEEAFEMGGGATVPVIAEFYVNFGEAATYAGMLLTGIAVQSIYISLLRRLAYKKGLNTLLALTFFGMGLVTLAVNSVFGYLLYTLAPIAACLIGLNTLTYMLRRRNWVDSMATSQ